MGARDVQSRPGFLPVSWAGDAEGKPSLRMEVFRDLGGEKGRKQRERSSEGRGCETAEMRGRLLDF